MFTFEKCLRQQDGTQFLHESRDDGLHACTFGLGLFNWPHSGPRYQFAQLLSRLILLERGYRINIYTGHVRPRTMILQDMTPGPRRKWLSSNA
jgi:hypothetical protein